jgi:hypothetical protein
MKSAKAASAKGYAVDINCRHISQKQELYKHIMSFSPYSYC